MTTTPLRILVVEDNDALLGILCDMLATLGYDATCVANAEDALMKLRSQTFDVLLSDISLPGKSGIELATIAVGMHPGMQVIFSSGYGYLVSDRLEFDFVLLHKPYYIQDLAHAVGQAAKRLPKAL